MEMQNETTNFLLVFLADFTLGSRYKSFKVLGNLFELCIFCTSGSFLKVGKRIPMSPQSTFLSDLVLEGLI